MKCECKNAPIAVAKSSSGSIDVTVCTKCGRAWSDDHGLTDEQIAAIVAAARAVVSNRASSRLTTHKKPQLELVKNGKAK